MTITKPFEVIGYISQPLGPRGRYAKITVRVEPAEAPEFVNKVTGEDFEDSFAEAAFDGIRGVSQKYSWLCFRFIITEAVVHPVDSSAEAFRMAGQAAAETFFKQIYKKLTITANKRETKIVITDPEGWFVQDGVGRLETGLMQGEYDIFFGDSSTPIHLDLYEDMALHEGR
jgi:hypothetical protein